MTNQVHEGRNVKRFREMLGIKQETLAYELGEGWTQKKISQLEAKEHIEDDLLEQVAKILNISPEAIQHFSEEAAINIISNTFHDSSGAGVGAYNTSSTFTFNPIDKLIESYEENKKLYERLLEAEKSKVELMERLLNSK